MVGLTQNLCKHTTSNDQDKLNSSFVSLIRISLSDHPNELSVTILATKTKKRLQTIRLYQVSRSSGNRMDDVGRNHTPIAGPQEKNYGSAIAFFRMPV